MRYASAPPYRVHQRDAAAHVVEHLRYGIFSYAIFAVDSDIAYGPVQKADTPLTVMVREIDTDTLELLIAVPDLRLPRRANMGFLQEEDVNVETRPTVINLHFRGAWEKAGGSDEAIVGKYNDYSVMIEVCCKDGFQQRVVLKRK